MSFAALRRQTNPLHLQFKGVDIKIVDHKGQPWVTAKDAGLCLGYADPEDSVNRLYRRNKERFKATETAEIEIEIPYGEEKMGGQVGLSSSEKSEGRKGKMSGQSDRSSSSRQAMRKMKVRIFSLRGLDRLGILSRTDVAWEFHDWVLDVLEGKSPNAALVQDHYRILNWFFSTRPHWRIIHNEFLVGIHSFESITRKVRNNTDRRISVESVRRAAKLMCARGVISQADYDRARIEARAAIPYWRGVYPEMQLELAF